MKLRSLIVSALLGLSLAACNAGSSLPSSSSTTTTTTTATSTITAAASGTTQSLPTVSAVSAASLTLPTLSVPFSGTVTTATTLPSNVTTFDYARQPQSLTVSNATPVFYIAATPSVATTVSGTVSASFTLASTPSTSVNYYAALYTGTAWTPYAVTSPATVSGNTISFSNIAITSFSLSAGTTYALVIYTVPASVTGSVNASGQSINGITLADGSTASITLPTLAVTGSSASPTFTYTAFDNVSLLSGFTTPSSGTFEGAVTVTPAASYTIPSATSATVALAPSVAAEGKVFTAYYLTSSSSTALATFTASTSGATTSAAVPFTSAFALTGSTSYTVAIYHN